MMISFNKIVLRDQIKSDIDDEIRWMTEETGWIKADTPWESVIQIDPEQLKKTDDAKYIPFKSRVCTKPPGDHSG